MDNGASSYLRFLNGDDDAFVEIIKEYKDGLILYLDSFTHDLYEAEDLMEDTFVKIVTKKPPFHGRSSFKTWLYAIARNTACDHLRRHRHKTVSSEELENNLAAEDDLERQYIRQEQRILVRRALRKLKTDHAQVLYLVYFEGFSNSQAGVIMRKTTRQIENLLYRAKASLKAHLIREGFTYEEL